MGRTVDVAAGGRATEVGWFVAAMAELGVGVNIVDRVRSCAPTA